MSAPKLIIKFFLGFFIYKIIILSEMSSSSTYRLKCLAIAIEKKKRKEAVKMYQSYSGGAEILHFSEIFKL